MDKKKIWILVLLFYSCFMFLTGEAEGEWRVKGENSFFDRFMINNFPGGFSYMSFIENYVPDITLLIEESNGFALIDRPRVYFEGDSTSQFNWYYNGFDIGSSLNTGAPSVVLPLSVTNSYQIYGQTPLSSRYGFFYHSGVPRRNLSRLTLSTTVSDLGSYGPWATFMVYNHASLRDDMLYSSRRRLNDNYYVDYNMNKHFNWADIGFAFTYFDINRQFNDFHVMNQTFEENAQLITIQSRVSKQWQQKSWEILAVLNFMDRTNLHAELGRLPEETVFQKRNVFFTGFHLHLPFMDFKLSYTHEMEELDPVVDSYGKDLMDNDGEGMFPFSPLGKFRTHTTVLGLNIPLLGGRDKGGIHLTAYLDARYAAIYGEEEVYQYPSYLFSGEPYLLLQMQPGFAYRNFNTRAQAGTRLHIPLGSVFSLDGNLFFKYQKLTVNQEDNCLTASQLGYDLGLSFTSGGTSILLAYGDIPYDLSTDLNFFLEQQRPSATLFRWQDANGDGEYQSGETSTVFGYSGGAYHFLDENVTNPTHRRLLLSVSLPLFKNWIFKIKGLYKTIINNFWVAHRENYGFYEEVNGRELFFYNQPFQDFTLTNQAFEKDPFYAQFLLQLTGGEKDRWIYSFSFLAHIGMGTTMFGNGPGANDYGLIHESQANPNSWINGHGRLDGDRGYMAKMFFGWYWLKNLFLSVSLKYRDGDPFAFFEHLNQYEQWVIYYQTIKAEDDRGVKGGPREDYVADISLKLSYNFRLFNRKAVVAISFFNWFDSGSELSEYVFSGGSRDAVELQIPRSMRFTFSYQF